MTTYKTYRNGVGSLPVRIRAAVSHFYRTRQVLPASIAVNPVEVNAARGAVGALTLGLSAQAGRQAGVPVEVNGGCLAGEVWLEIQD